MAQMSKATHGRLPVLLARTAGVLVFFAGALVLVVGWWLDIPSFKSVVPGLNKMAAGSALAFALTGSALWYAAATLPYPAGGALTESSRRWRRRLIRSSGVAVAIIGFLKVTELLTGWSLAVDQLWFNEPSSRSAPARMSPATALNFVMLGCALLLACESRFVAAFECLTLCAGVLGWLGFSHYVYGGDPLTPYGEMAVHTAASFLLLSGGLLCLRTDGGLMALLVSDSTGGALARGTVPAILVLPILFGWLRLQGQRAGWYSNEAGVSLQALANILIFGGLIWANATLLHRTDLRRKLAEEQVLSLNADLEKRIQERTFKLDRANQEMEAFIYSLAHDLRAPLRHITAFSRILARDLGATLAPDAQECLEKIRRASGKMNQLVEDLLRLAKLARHELKLEPTPLGPLLQAVMADLKAETEGRELEWRIHPLPTIECDPELLKQLFASLLSNAIKFSRTRQHAIIEVGCLRHDPRAVLFVRDNGVGFDMAYAHRLFGVFQRLHHADHFEGTGVGLAVAEHIVRSHGGRIWVEAALDQGAAVYFTLNT